MQVQEPINEPRIRRWTKAEFYRMADLGWFKGQRAELVGGEIMVLSPQRFPHSAATDRAAEVLRNALGHAFWVRMQLPLDLGLDSELEPDVSVVPGKRADYAGHPTTAVLVVEISDTSLAYDRGEKASLYAAAGVEDYWIVNVADAQVEVRRSPGPTPGQRFGFGYARVTTLRNEEAFSPLASPAAQFRANDFIS